MKRQLAMILAGLLLSACAPGTYYTGTGAAVGGGIGAVMGQAVGHSTESTLVGAGVGALIGSVIGSYEDQRVNGAGVYYETVEPRTVYVDPAPSVYIAAPQYRVTVPGRWKHSHRPPPPPPPPRIFAPPRGHLPPFAGLRNNPPRVAPRHPPDRRPALPRHPSRLDGRHPPSLSLNAPGRPHGQRPPGDRVHRDRPRGDERREQNATWKRNGHPHHGKRFENDR